MEKMGPGLLIIGGLLCLIAGFGNWDWYYTLGLRKFKRDSIGRIGSRILDVAFGLVMVVIGLAAFISPDGH